MSNATVTDCVAITGSVVKSELESFGVISNCDDQSSRLFFKKRKSVTLVASVHLLQALLHN